MMACNFLKAIKGLDFKRTNQKSINLLNFSPSMWRISSTIQWISKWRCNKCHDGGKSCEWHYQLWLRIHSILVGILQHALTILHKHKDKEPINFTHYLKAQGKTWSCPLEESFTGDLWKHIFIWWFRTDPPWSCWIDLYSKGPSFFFFF